MLVTLLIVGLAVSIVLFVIMLCDMSREIKKLKEEIKILRRTIADDSSHIGRSKSWKTTDNYTGVW